MSAASLAASSPSAASLWHARPFRRYLGSSSKFCDSSGREVFFQPACLPPFFRGEGKNNLKGNVENHVHQRCFLLLRKDFEHQKCFLLLRRDFDFDVFHQIFSTFSISCNYPTSFPKFTLHQCCSLNVILGLIKFREFCELPNYPRYFA